MVVSMRRSYLLEVFATIGRLPHLEVRDVNRVRVGRVGKHVHVIPRSMDKIPVGANVFPTRAIVI